ncbi:MAG: sulfotransferase [Planctomycetaceae bacterium]|nr:sulfotransferase [Planctomycetaceae bacterium]
MMVTVIGRGHGGTRAMSHTLSASGVYMGGQLNGSGDLIPPGDMYDACRVLGKYVKWTGDLTWDWSALHEGPIDGDFKRLIESFLVTVLESRQENRGWKIPETTLAYPWIRRMFPDMKYIFWIRDPRDSILSHHVTDDLRVFNIQYPPTDDVRRMRAISWKYQNDLIRATPRPRHWIKVRFEDFILDQDATLKRLEAFLGIPLAKIPVRPDSVGRWKSDTENHWFDFLAPAMDEHGYQR